MFGKFSAQNKDLLAGVVLRPPDVTFDQEATIDLGGITARLLWFGGAHTKGDELTFVDAQGIVYPGVEKLQLRLLTLRTCTINFEQVVTHNGGRAVDGPAQLIEQSVTFTRFCSQSRSGHFDAAERSCGVDRHDSHKEKQTREPKRKCTGLRREKPAHCLPDRPVLKS